MIVLIFLLIVSSYFLKNNHQKNCKQKNCSQKDCPEKNCEQKNCSQKDCPEKKCVQKNCSQKNCPEKNCEQNTKFYKYNRYSYAITIDNDKNVTMVIIVVDPNKKKILRINYKKSERTPYNIKIGQTMENSKIIIDNKDNALAIKFFDYNDNDKIFLYSSAKKFWFSFDEGPKTNEKYTLSTTDNIIKIIK